MNGHDGDLLYDENLGNSFRNFRLLDIYELCSPTDAFPMLGDQAWRMISLSEAHMFMNDSFKK
jgi:hypothetical protein